MSTILKALQRLEQEKESSRPSGPTPVFSKPRSTMGGMTGWFLTPWVRRGTVGFIIIVLSVVAFHFYRQSRSHSLKQAKRTGVLDEQAPPAKAGRNYPVASVDAPIAKKDSAALKPEISGRPGQPTAKLPSAVAQAKPRASGINPNHPQPSLPSISKTAESPVQEQPAQAPIPGTGVAGGPNGVSRRPRPSDIPVAETPAPPADADQTGDAPEKPTVKASPAAGKKRSSDAFEHAPPLTDGRLKVHAIAWSPTAEERMAVVNNRVIYEGDSVDNFVVVAIRPDDVVVREKEKGLWKVIFGRP